MLRVVVPSVVVPLSVAALLFLENFAPKIIKKYRADIFRPLFEIVPSFFNNLRWPNNQKEILEKEKNFNNKKFSMIQKFFSS